MTVGVTNFEYGDTLIDPKIAIALGRWPAFLALSCRVAMDEAHLVAAFRYVALNPVRAGLVKRAAEWKWSSTRTLCNLSDDGEVAVAPVLDRVGDFMAFQRSVRRGRHLCRPAQGRKYRPPDRFASMAGRYGRKDGPSAQARKARTKGIER